MELRAGCKRTELGQVPNEWQVKTFKDVSRVNQGLQVAISERLKRDAKHAKIYITIQFLNDKKNIEYIEKYSTSVVCEVNDVLMTRTGNTGFVVSGVEGVFHNNFFKIVYDKGILDGKFLCAFLRLPSTQKVILAKAGASTIPDLNHSDFYSIPVPLPPLPEQRAIATALSDVDALLAKIDQLIAKKRDLKQAAMQQLLTGQTRLPGFSGEWEVKRLGDMAETGSGGTPPSSVTAYYDGDIPWVSIADMTGGGKIIFTTERNLTLEGVKNSAAQIFPVGTVLYAMYASIGECSIAGVPLCSSQAILGIRTKAMLDKDFLFYHLTSLKSIIKTMGQQGTQSNLNAGMVRAFEIKLPKLAEQTAIATVLSDMDAELTALQARRDKTRELKQGMMQALLTGRIRLV